jgi:hypothetical protein
VRRQFLHFRLAAAVFTLLVIVALGRDALSQQGYEADTVLFHHVAVSEMTDSAARIMEVVIFASSGNNGSVGMKLPLAAGFFDLEIPDSEGWGLDPEGDGIVRLLPLEKGESSIALSYGLPVANGRFEFREAIANYTDRYLFGTRSEEIALSSDILAPMEEAAPGGLKALRAQGIPAGSMVSVTAVLGAPGGKHGLFLGLALVFVSGVVIYVTARYARSACQSDGRIDRLRRRKESIAAILARLEEGGELKGEESREIAAAYRDRLAATERLLALLEELRKDGTRS